jgi:hypothetical protein
MLLAPDKIFNRRKFYLPGDTDEERQAFNKHDVNRQGYVAVEGHDFVRDLNVIRRDGWWRYPDGFAFESCKVGTKYCVSVGNVRGSNRAVLNHIGTHHVLEIFWVGVTNEGERFSCPLGTFVVAVSESLSVRLYRVDCRFVGVKHKEGSVGGVVIVKATVTLFENNVFVGFDNVKIVVVFAVISDWNFFLTR